MTWNSSSKCLVFTHGFPQKPLYCGLDSKESTCNAGDPGSIPGSGRSPGEGNDYPLHYFSLENSMDRGAWQTTIHGVSKSRTGLSDKHLHSSWFITVKWIRRRISKKMGTWGQVYWQQVWASRNSIPVLLYDTRHAYSFSYKPRQHIWSAVCPRRFIGV